MFNVAMAKADYKGKYVYCYCTKSSHFSFVLDEVLKNDVHIETSSAYDIQIIREQIKKKMISKETFIICVHGGLTERKFNWKKHPFGVISGGTHYQHFFKFIQPIWRIAIDVSIFFSH